MKHKKRKGFLLLLLFSILTVFVNPTSTYAQDDLSGYSNPKDVIIASPTNNLKTTASKMSILGACDYRYPLYMNGDLIKTTEHGFFTVYVELKVGNNVFTFTNNGKKKSITIIRTQPSSSTSGSAKETVYTKDVYGVLNKNYGTRRAKPSTSDVIITPLAQGTAFRILGEVNGYYKMADGTYLQKDGDKITVYNKKLADNKVSDISIYEDTASNMMMTRFKMNINALYTVNVKENKLVLTLYDTVSAAKASTPQNDTIKNIMLSLNSSKKTAVYTINLKNDASVTGYDVTFKDGYLYLGLKKAPILFEKGSLKGAKIVIDAGHGGSDTGAVGPMGKYGPVEKDINLSIAQTTKKYLEDLGATVIMIRNDDTFISLYDRVNIIKNKKPDLAVSIHGNSLDQSTDFSTSTGYLTFYSFAQFQNAHAMINQYIIDNIGFNTIRQPRYQNLALTRVVNCPAVLLETSFLSNPNDYELLIKKSYQEQFGIVIGEAIKEYIESVAVYDSKKASASVSENTKIHIVQKGDTLSTIAKKYNTTVSKLAALNKLKDINYIYLGQRLTVVAQ